MKMLSVFVVFCVLCSFACFVLGFAMYFSMCCKNIDFMGLSMS